MANKFKYKFDDWTKGSSVNWIYIWTDILPIRLRHFSEDR